MLHALEHIRRMRGGAQAHLLRCSDGGYYVVKFQNKPQHRRVLVNELLGTKLAARLGLPVPQVAVVDVPEALIRYTADLVMQLGQSSVPCRAGLQFASRYPGDPRELTLHDFLPDEQLREVENLGDFAGMLAYDKWTCNTNGRQAIFLRHANHAPYRALMIDQGFCFNAGEWNFPDAPLRGLYTRQRVYEGVIGMESFAPWLERLETRVTPGVFDELSKQIPPEWYEDNQDELYRLLETLDRRRARVRELLVDAKRSNRQPFPNWT